MNPLRWISTALCSLALTSTGCLSKVGGLSAYMGGTGALGLSEENHGVGAGPHVGALTHFGRDSGPAAGGELETSGMLGSEVPEPRARWRVEGLVGHVWTPLPHRSPVGFELWGHGGYGRFPARHGNTGAVVLGPRLGLPIRFDSSAPIWDAEKPLWTTFLLVPSLGGNFYFPTSPEVDSAPRSELTAHLSLRLYFWSSLMP